MDLNFNAIANLDDVLLKTKNKICSLKTEDLLTTEEAASFLKISVGTLRNLTSNGHIPYYKFGRRNRYILDDLRKLILSNKRGNHGY